MTSAARHWLRAYKFVEARAEKVGLECVITSDGMIRIAWPQTEGVQLGLTEARLYLQGFYAGLDYGFRKGYNARYEGEACTDVTGSIYDDAAMA